MYSYGYNKFKKLNVKFITPINKGGTYMKLSLVIFIIGILLLLAPKILWSIGGGSKHEGVEPTVGFTVASRGIGIILFIIAIVIYTKGM